MVPRRRNNEEEGDQNSSNVQPNRREEKAVIIKGFGDWLDKEGKQFRNPIRPKNWLGGEVVAYTLTLALTVAHQYFFRDANIVGQYSHSP